MNRLTDQQLLREYAGRQWEAAFAELVRRHLDFVHSAARRMVCDAHLAEDVTQSVFAALAQNARQLAGHPVLSGWLHRTAQNLAANVVRSEVRRRAREQEAAAMNELLAAASEPRWEQIAPHLDAALGELSEADRDAVLLRYFEKKSAGEMAQILGVSADTAQKRVSRAVERLREFFSKRNVTIGASGLAAVISANAVQAAPLGLALTICTATLAGTAVSTAAVIAATKTIAMTTLQKTVVTAALAVAAGAGIFEARQAAQLRGQNQTLQQQQTPLAEQIRQLQRERDDATNRLAGLLAENTRLKSNPHEMELLKLRGQVGQLRTAESVANDPFVKNALEWKAKEAKLRKLFDDRPDQRIPEMQFLTDRQWLDIARDAPLDSEEGIHVALGTVRNRAQNAFAQMMQQALKKYMGANNGNPPDNPSQLKSFFDIPVDDDVLQRYEMLDDAQQQSDWAKGAVLVEKPSAVIDKWMDGTYAIGPQFIRVAPLPAPVHLTFPKELVPAMQAYQANNNGKSPNDFSELKPFVSTPEQGAALENLVNTINQAQVH